MVMQLITSTAFTQCKHRTEAPFPGPMPGTPTRSHTRTHTSLINKKQKRRAGKMAQWERCLLPSLFDLT